MVTTVESLDVRIYPKMTVKCECGRKIGSPSTWTIVGPSRFLCPTCATGKPWPCWKCGRPSSGAGCYNDDMKFDSNIPYRPICKDCRPQWIAVSPLNEGARQSGVKPGDKLP